MRYCLRYPLHDHRMRVLPCARAYNTHSPHPDPPPLTRHPLHDLVMMCNVLLSSSTSLSHNYNRRPQRQLFSEPLHRARSRSLPPLPPHFLPHSPHYYICSFSKHAVQHGPCAEGRGAREGGRERGMERKEGGRRGMEGGGGGEGREEGEGCRLEVSEIATCVGVEFRVWDGEIPSHPDPARPCVF